MEFLFSCWTLYEVEHSLIHSCLLCQLACRAATKMQVPHSSLFWASVWMVPQVWRRVLTAPSTVQRQVFLGCPHFGLCPVKGWDVPWPSSHHMCDQSPLLSHDGTSAVQVAVGEEMLVGDGLRPEYLQDSCKVLGMERRQFVEVTFSHPPAFWAVQYKLHSSGTVLAWSWCYTGITFTCCLAFWRHCWPCWGNSW